MTRGRPRRQPSGRNLELYHELVGEGRLQAEVAARFRVSQPRVAHIRRTVSQWVEDSLPAAVDDAASVVMHGNPGIDDTASVVNVEAHRLHLAIALRRLQLQEAYGKYLEHFGGESGAEGYGHLLAASAAGVLPKEAAARLPPRDLVQSAVVMARELADLARVAERGPFAELPLGLQKDGAGT